MQPLSAIRTAAGNDSLGRIVKATIVPFAWWAICSSSLLNADLVTPPGNPTPFFFDTNFNGNDASYFFTSTINVEIGGADASLYDQIINVDELTLSGATLVVDFVSPSGPGSSYCPEAGHEFQLFRFNSVAPSPSLNLRLDSRLPLEGLAWDTSDLFTTGTLRIAAIPEASSLLCFSGLAFLLLAKRLATAYCVWFRDCCSSR